MVSRLNIPLHPFGPNLDVVFLLKCIRVIHVSGQGAWVLLFRPNWPTRDGYRTN
jgi:hypothetical protein